MRILLLPLLLAGCTTSDVYHVAGNQYGISSSAITSFGGAAKARSDGIKRAEAYCSQQGKTAIVTDTTADSNIAQGSSDIKFRCE